MKFLTIVIFVCFSVTLFSQSLPVNKLKTLSSTEHAVLGYETCLSHENEGVVESAICNVLKFSYRNPDADLNHVINLLSDLHEKSKNAKIRSKAFVVSQLLKYPELIAEMGDTFYDDMDKLISILCYSMNLTQPETDIISINRFLKTNFDLQ
jgi:hypothetical protein